MKYSEKFKKEAIKVLGEDCLDYLESGNMMVGRILDEKRGFAPNPEKVIAALEGDEKLKAELLESAKKANAYQKLYLKWREEYYPEKV